MKKLSLLVIMCAIISMLNAQNTTNPVEKPFIEVTGTSEMLVVPDEIYISIVLRERILDKVKITIEDQETKLKMGLQSIGVELDNLFLSDANADYVRIKRSNKEVISSKEYQLKVGTAEIVGKVFQELDKMEVNDARIARVSHSKIEEFRKEVKIKAIKSAKEKANYLLESIDETVGSALIVRETDAEVIGGVYNSKIVAQNQLMYDDFKAGSSAYFSDTQFQKIRLSSTIFVKFEIK